MDSVQAKVVSEQQMVVVWKEVLGVDNIGLDDNIFALGGHSLLIQKIISVVRERFGIEMEQRNFYEAKTIRELVNAFSEGVLVEKLDPLFEPNAFDRFPLSLQQRSFWFLSGVEGSSTAFNVPVFFRIKGELNNRALRKSIVSLLGRHEILRTHIVESEGNFIQVVQPTPEIEIPIVCADEHDLDDILKLEAIAPFDLNQNIPLKVKVIKLGENDNVLCLVVHHVAVDGWSIGVLMRELEILYSSYVNDLPSPLPQPYVQYGDYVLWQQNSVVGAVYDRQISFWKNKLQGLPPLLNFPLDRQRSPEQSFKGGVIPVDFSKGLNERLKRYCKERGVTLFNVLLAGYSILLSRYARTSDVPIGTAVANRKQTILDDMVGCFASTVVVRCQIEEGITFDQYLDGIGNSALEAFDNSDIPFDSLVKAINPPRSPGVPPIIQVMFRLHSQDLGLDLSMKGLETFPLMMDSPAAQLDLNLSLTETEYGVVGQITYATDLFDESTVRRLLRHYENLLNVVLGDPNCQLSGLSFIGDDEVSQFASWNDTSLSYPQNECIHALFELSALRYPEKLAYECGKENLSYHELNLRANQLAHWLRAQGVGPEVRVGVCVGRSLWMGISMLAIMKSGGTYVPLDSEYPKERLSHMLELAKPALIFTEEALLHRLPESSVRTLCLDFEGGLWAKASQDNPAHPTGANHSAYILFTSGTTGQPKGILVAHHSLRNMELAHKHWKLLDRDARILQFASFSFSVSIWGSFMAWAAGASLYQVTDEEAFAGEALYQLLGRAQISTVTWPVSLLSVLPLERMPGSLKTIISSAEPCNENVAGRWAGIGCRFLNLYGSSEVSIGSTMFEYQSSGQKLTLGRALPNTRMYLLDENLMQVPVGVVAEIYTAGVGLAKSYVDNPKETEMRFISNPLSSGTGGRLYKTGDLGRYLSNGEIEFVGREDFQVNIRGFRVELAEIENTLRMLACVDDVVVLARQDGQNIDLLVCFYTVNVENKDYGIVTEESLREFLAERLPSYMMPSLFVLLDSLPLTPNRKVDRLLLSSLDISVSKESEYIDPQTKLDKELCYIWSGVLGVDKVSLSDNFFYLGGHSLLAIRLINVVNNRYDRNFPVTALFKAPTIAEFSALFLEDSSLEEISMSSLRLMRAGNTDHAPIFVIPGVGGSLFNLFDLSSELADFGPVYGLQAVGLEGDTRPLETVEEIASANVNEILSVQSQGPYLLVDHSFGGWIVYEMARRLRESKHAVSVVLLDSPMPNETDNLYRKLSDGLYSADQLDSFIERIVNLGSRNSIEISNSERLLEEKVRSIARLQAKICYEPDFVLSGVNALYIRAAKGESLFSEGSLQWSTLFDTTVSHESIASDHFGMLQRDSAQIIASIIHRYRCQWERSAEG